MANGKKTPLTNRGLFGQMATPEGNRVSRSEGSMPPNEPSPWGRGIPLMRGSLTH